MKRFTMIAMTMVLIVPTMAQAQMAVFDGAAFQQLIQQVSAWRQQLQAMQMQLRQLQQTHSALTGTRGMQSLLRSSPQTLNYLPNDAQTLIAVSGGGGGAQYAGLGSEVTRQTTQNSVMTQAMLSRLSPQLSELVIRERMTHATHQILSRAAYTEASTRFNELTSLINEIGAATDAKAIADLQARNLGEQILLANDIAKLQSLAQIAAADQAVSQQSARESAFVNHGHFATRFQPIPPAP